MGAVCGTFIASWSTFRSQMSMKAEARFRVEN